MTERPILKYLCMVPDAIQGEIPDMFSGQAMPVETYSPELARQEAAAHMNVDPKRVHVVDVTNNPAMLAVVDDMLAQLKSKLN